MPIIHGDFGALDDGVPDYEEGDLFELPDDFLLSVYRTAVSLYENALAEMQRRGLELPEKVN